MAVLQSVCLNEVSIASLVSLLFVKKFVETGSLLELKNVMIKTELQRMDVQVFVKLKLTGSVLEFLVFVNLSVLIIMWLGTRLVTMVT